jgi:hypothetical protein
MTRRSPRELGKVAAKELHKKLESADLLDGLLERIIKTMPEPVQEAHAEDPQFRPMLSNTAGQYALCFACACLAHDASEGYTKRIFGVPVSADKESRNQFTEGLIEYATELMKHPATRADIIEGINDQGGAVTRFCRNYPPEASATLNRAANQIRQVVREVLNGI